MKKYQVECVRIENLSSPPDLMFYKAHPYFPPSIDKRLDRVDCLRVFLTDEYEKPDFRFFDYAFSFFETDARNFQWLFFSHSCYHPYFQKFRVGLQDDELRRLREHPKNRFCNFIHRFPRNKQRADIVKKLMTYKRVDCPGKMFNNMSPIGPGSRAKLNFIKQHKFTIAFENKSASHYVTEKIFEALLVNSVPIYWGSPRIAEYFNPEAFINCHDYDNLDQVVDRVIEVDNDDELYQQYVNVPPVLKGSIVDAMSDDVIGERLDKIVSNIGVQVPVATTRAYKRKLPLYRFTAKANRFMRNIKQNYFFWRRKHLEGKLWGFFRDPTKLRNQ